MVPTGLFVVVVWLILILTAGPLVLQWAIRIKATHAVLAAIIDKGKPVDFKLLKIIDGEWIEDKKDRWLIVTEQCKLARYPTIFPKFLYSFTQIVPCELVMRGKAEPIDWENPDATVLSSKELPAILDPHWMVALVRGIEDSGVLGNEKGSKRFALLAFAAAGMCLVLIFVIMYRLNSLSAQVAALPKLIHP